MEYLLSPGLVDRNKPPPPSTPLSPTRLPLKSGGSQPQSPLSRWAVDYYPRLSPIDWVRLTIVESGCGLLSTPVAN
ncbi:hypothetical protein HGRIS_013308 [Hohenbuehelia grisea]|uniref:Uncharacterized protein n=1 Tax=Hohenbuehelia grisea TaxID=104357 RepID=A0ABR3IV96_9AGAR